MKNLLKYALLAIMVWVFVGCGSKEYAITYNTNPIGANIVCGGVGKGLSPLTLYYDRDGINDEGLLYTTPCKAVFSSGYLVDTRNLLAPNGIQINSLMAFNKLSLDHKVRVISRI